MDSPHSTDAVICSGRALGCQLPLPLGARRIHCRPLLGLLASASDWWRLKSRALLLLHVRLGSHLASTVGRYVFTGWEILKM